MTTDLGLPTRVPMSAGARRTSTVLLLMICWGCGSLTAVDATDIVQPSALANPAGAEALRAGAMNSFAVAYAGGLGRSQVTMSGTMADEFTTPLRFGNFGQADQRIVPEPSASYPYAETQQARVDAGQAITALQRFSPSPRSRIGELFALSGFTKIFLAENLCSGIPLGGFEDGRPIYGEPLSNAEILARAIADLDSALVYATDSARILNLARVGTGRALLGLGRFDDAAAAVAGVPTAFTYQVEYAAATTGNGVYDATTTYRFLGVADLEGRNGLDFRTANDPRVPTRLVGKGIDGATDVYAFTRYGASASPVPLATGTEARLIEAEAALRAGDAARSLAILNELRAAMPGLAPLAPQSTDSARVDQLFRERAFWLFATGHRQGDLRRLARQYGRPASSLFPTGPYPGGLAYGSDVTFTPNSAQGDNPKYSGCGERSP